MATEAVGPVPAISSALPRHPCGLLDGLIWPEGQRAEAPRFPATRTHPLFSAGAKAPLHRETK
jgi:hypothetical protein